MIKYMSLKSASILFGQPRKKSSFIYLFLHLYLDFIYFFGINNQVYYVAI